MAKSKKKRSSHVGKAGQQPAGVGKVAHPDRSPGPEAGMPGPVPLGPTLLLRVRLDSDWHVGTGTGRPGDVDRVVARDPDGLPFLPAKTLTGILRDACEQVAHGLDGGRSGGPWSRWVRFLFGDQPGIGDTGDEGPLPAALSVRPARFSDTLRAVLGRHPALVEALTFVKPGVKLDPGTGCALQDHLRFVEMVRGDVVLEARLSVRLPEGEGARFASALLVLGVAFAERLGGKRRRGAGRARLRIDGEDPKPWIAWVRAASAVPDVPVLPTPGAPRGREPALSGEWRVVPLVVVSETPIVARSQTAGNVVETLDFVPGTFLLGHVLRSLRPLGVDLDEAVGGGGLIVTSATPDVDGTRGRAVPLCLLYDKGRGDLARGGTVWNGLVEAGPQGASLKSHRQGYLGDAPESEGGRQQGGGAHHGQDGAGSRLPGLVRTPCTVRTHNIVDDAVQRPTRQTGGVYTYEAIAAGTRLRAELRLRKAVADALAARDPQWFRRLGGEARLGVAKKDDYGMARVEVREPKPFVRKGPAAGPTLTVWLLSDCLLRDERLRPSADPTTLASELSTRLGCTLVPRPRGQARPSELVRERRSEGWQTSWGLPRPSLAGLRAGSCVVFGVAKEAVAAAALEEVEASGVGERRAEGFGQVRFDDPLLVAATSQMAPPSPRTAQAGSVHPGPTGRPAQQGSGGEEQPLTKDEADLVASLEETCWRRALVEAARARAGDAQWRRDCLGWTVDGLRCSPRQSQLGALRSALSAGVDEARRCLDRLRDRGRPATESPATLAALEKPKLVWEWLDPEGRLPVATPARREELQGQLWWDAVYALLTAAARSHSRDAQAGKRQGAGVPMEVEDGGPY